jgi:hypothetical protein
MDSIDTEQDWVDSRAQVLKSLDVMSFSQWKLEFWIHFIGLTLIISLTQYFHENLTIPLVVSWLGIAINLRLIRIFFVIQQVATITNSHLNEIGQITRYKAGE